MRKPTPVTTRIITEESGSSWKAAGAEKPPAATHGKRTWTKRRAWGGRAAGAEVGEDPVYHLSTLSSVTSTVSFRRKIAIRIASPTAASAAATVMTMKAHTDAATSPR